MSWYVYVPIHELLHALGCAATGGTVTTLEVQTQYGGAILALVLLQEDLDGPLGAVAVGQVDRDRVHVLEQIEVQCLRFAVLQLFDLRLVRLADDGVVLVGQ